MEAIEYIKLANNLKNFETRPYKKVVIRLVTNFTDEILAKLLTGKVLSQAQYPEVLKTPYKQYHFLFKDRSSQLYSQSADITFIFFDVNIYNLTEFKEASFFKEILEEIKYFVKNQAGIVVINNFVLPYHSAYGNLISDNDFFKLVESYNQALASAAGDLKNFYIFDTNRLVHRIGEKNARDLRSLYAFDLPFTTEFLKTLSEEWYAYIFAKFGQAKKCLVLDLDNVLWGGVVGESGLNGIALGPDYPGLAFKNFQQAVLDFHNRGVILAINSKNNLSDVEEVFGRHAHMVLKREHFAAMRVNWHDKATNLRELSQELNIGPDSMVFLDDDPVNRELVKQQLPDVYVPEFTLEPEEYAEFLFSLPVFSPLPLTPEDKAKGRMYQEEQQRKAIQTSAKDLNEYIKQLKIELKPALNDPNALARLSQMTLKTNQFNLTTRRYSEKEIENFMQKGWVFFADVTDKFGAYGITIMAIAIKEGSNARLDSFLMSCRVMGRGVEQKFFNFILDELKAKGVKELKAVFIPSPKNDPAKDFLPSMGFELLSENKERKEYTLNIA